MVSYIDIHCHIDFYENPEQYIKDNVIININGINPDANRKILKLSEKYDNVKASLGLYPSEALELTDEEIDKEIDFIRKNKPTAIGEVGMDFKEAEEKEKQEKNFRKFIRLSKELDIPIIVHSRKAERRTIEILEEEKAKKVIMHCFSGRSKYYKRIEDNGWYFTVPTIVRHAEQFQNLVYKVALSRLFCETDSPYMHPFKGSNNEPVLVQEAYKKIAEIKGIELEEVKNAIFMNYQNLF